MSSGKDILGTYSAACETIRKKITKVTKPIAGDIIFFKGSRHAGANHIGIVYKVDSSYVYTIEGNTSGGSTVVDNGGGVAKKKYSLNYSSILSYGRPKYTKDLTAKKLIAIAKNEVGYLEKKTNAKLDSKTANAGRNNYTKYGAWAGMNGQFWCASFVSWCFDQLGKGVTIKTTTTSSTSTAKKAYAGTFPPATIKYGDKGTNVKNMQKFLEWYGKYGLTCDGKFGPATKGALISFQKKEGLTADAIWGVKTLAKAKTIKK